LGFEAAQTERHDYTGIFQQAEKEIKSGAEL
jgi:hypothetical protein